MSNPLFPRRLAPKCCRHLIRTIASIRQDVDGWGIRVAAARLQGCMRCIRRMVFCSRMNEGGNGGREGTAVVVLTVEYQVDSNIACGLLIDGSSLVASTSTHLPERCWSRSCGQPARQQQQQQQQRQRQQQQQRELSTLGFHRLGPKGARANGRTAPSGTA